MALVSSDFVTKYLAGQNPIGRRVTVPLMGLTRVAPVTREIVGVVAPIRPSHDGDDSDQLYVPLTQNAWANSTLVRDDAVEAVRAMKEHATGPLSTIGSLSLSRSLLRAGLVDRATDSRRPLWRSPCRRPSRGSIPNSR